MIETTYYLNDDGNIVTKARATRFIRTVHDDNGYLILESFGTVIQRQQ